MLRRCLGLRAAAGLAAEALGMVMPVGEVALGAEPPAPSLAAGGRPLW